MTEVETKIIMSLNELNRLMYMAGASTDENESIKKHLQGLSAYIVTIIGRRVIKEAQEKLNIEKGRNR